MREETMMPGMAINKMPFVKNEGTTDTYVRIRVLIPAAYDQDQLVDSVLCTTALKDGEFKRPEGFGFYTPEPAVTRGEELYNQYTFIHNEVLEPGEMTYWNVWNTIVLDPSIDQDDPIAVAGEFDVLVEVDAIQAFGFANVDEAFAAFDAQENEAV